MSINLTPLEAYQAMIHFLSDYYQRGGGSELAILLGAMDLNTDGKPMDPALWDDWLDAINRVEGNSIS